MAFPGNVIPADRISPVSRKLLDQFVPKANSGTNRYIVSPETVDNRDGIGTRFDYQLNQKHALLGRYLQTRTDAETPAITTAIGNTARATLSDYMGSDTYILTPHAINVARFSYNRIDAHPAVTSGLKNEDFGINVPNTNALAQGLASIAITGFFNLGDAQQPFVKRVNEVFQFTDDFTWSRGSHGLKFGADLRKEHMVIAFINRPNGDMTFNGQAASGNAAADFLLGFPSQFRRTTTNQAQDGVGWLYSGYAQDEWRASPHLTVNAGVRYELSLPFVDANDALNAFHPGVQSVRFPAAPAGLVYPGDPGRSARDLRHRQEQLRAALRRGVGSAGGRPDDDSRRVGNLLRRARRPGRLLPERRARAAVHAAGRGQLTAGVDHHRQSAGLDHRRRDALSAGPDDHRLGRGLPDAVRVSLQR